MGEGPLQAPVGAPRRQRRFTHKEILMAPGKSRLEKLKALEVTLAFSMRECENRELAAIARQYRETLKEIEEIEGAQANDDDISEILSERAAAGKSGAVR